MFKGIKNFILKKVVVQGIIARLEKLFAALPADDRKTICGLLVACIGLVLEAIPETSPYAQPILDYLKTLPTAEIVAGGIVWSTIGAFHKTLKWVIRIAGYQTTKEKAESKTATQVANKIAQHGAR